MTTTSTTTAHVEWGWREITGEITPVPLHVHKRLRPSDIEPYTRGVAAAEGLTVVKRTITVSPWEDA